jgi:superfamily II DNA/RNA helicase
LMNDLGVEKRNKGAVDLCFATSMIEVGVDVPRLGLMTVMGQPKSASQYIQVTGRVGRDDDAPGLVVVVLSPYNVRDRSHFENFRQNHERLYAAVESVSVTPFTAQSLSRAASGMLTTVLRATGNSAPIEALRGLEAQELLANVRSRASEFGDEHAVEALEIEIARLQQAAEAANRSNHSSWDSGGLLLRAGDNAPASEEFDHWIVPNSMRSVDLECGLQVVHRPGRAAKLDPSNPVAQNAFDEVGEDLF